MPKGGLKVKFVKPKSTYDGDSKGKQAGPWQCLLCENPLLRTHSGVRRHYAGHSKVWTLADHSFRDMTKKERAAQELKKSRRQGCSRSSCRSVDPAARGRDLVSYAPARVKDLGPDLRGLFGVGTGLAYPSSPASVGIPLQVAPCFQLLFRYLRNFLHLRFPGTLFGTPTVSDQFRFSCCLPVTRVCF